MYANDPHGVALGDDLGLHRHRGAVRASLRDLRPGRRMLLVPDARAGRGGRVGANDGMPNDERRRDRAAVHSSPFVDLVTRYFDFTSTLFPVSALL